MIRLKIQRRKPRENVVYTYGPWSNIYRCLCIAMLPEGDAIHTVEDVVSHSIDPDEHPKQHADLVEGTKAWAYNKDLNKTSDLVDQEGKPQRPYGWVAANWQESVPDKDHNRAVDIINEACAMHEESGKDGDTYWFAQAIGVIRVPGSRHAEHSQRCNQAYELIKEGLSEEEALSQVGIDAQDIEETTVKTRLRLGRKPLALVAAVLLGVFVGLAGFQSNLMDVLQNKGVKEASNHLQDGNYSLFETAWIAYRAGDNQKAREIANLLLANPEYKDDWVNCYYLLGGIEFNKGNFEDSLDFYQKSEQLANLYNLSESKPQIYFGIAKCSLYFENWSQFYHYVQLIPDSYTGYVLHLEAWAKVLESQDYASSIEILNNAIEFFKTEGNTTVLHVANIDLAIFHALHGQPSIGIDIISSTEHFIQENPGFDDYIFYYSQIFKIVIAKCAGWEKPIDTVRLLREKGQTYNYILELIDELQCQEG